MQRNDPRIRGLLRGSALALASSVIATPALAVPYASQVRNTSGSTWEYVINQDADSVVIKRDGGNEINLSAVSAGRYTFDMTGFSTFDIEVSHSGPSGMTLVSDETNLFTKFFRPNGLAINTDPTSQYFGTIYVANGIPATTGGDNARDTGDGIYAVRPDLQGIDFSTPVWAVPTANDTTQAKIGAGWEVGDQPNGSGSNSVFRISLDDAGNVIAGDWSDANGGLKYIGPDLTGGGLLLAQQDGPTGGNIDPNGPFDGSISPYTHGSIRGVPNVTGTVGVDLVVSAIDEDLTRNGKGLFDGTFPNPSLPDTDGDGFPNDGNHLWRWNFGSATNSQTKPDLLIDTGGDASLGQLGSDTSGRPYFLDLNIPVRTDAEFFPQLGTDGLWILTMPRFNGDESGITIVEVDDTGATLPQVLWSSRQFTIDNNLDGFPNDPPDLGDDPNSDVFRNTGTVDVSPDGDFLYVHRWLTDNPDAVDGDGLPAPDINPYLGRDSNLPGAILKIPLDSSGLPIITIDDNGTPSDPLDDSFTNLESVESTGQEAFNNQHEIEVDAAGNIYITDNATELLEVFTPGGDTLAVYSFDGSIGAFSVTELLVAPTLVGDYNDDGVVDAADYTVYRDALAGQPGVTLANETASPGVVDGADYAAWVGNFGASAAASVIPEPGTLAIAVGLACVGVTRRRR